jgi:3-oxoacyl-[acyl-carrier-protein] synthase II
MRAAFNKRIVVTGVGAVASIGVTRDVFWDRLRNGESGIRPISRFETSRFGRSNGGEISDFQIAASFPEQPSLHKLGRAKQMMLAAAKQCLDEAGYDVHRAPFDIGVAVGTTMGEAQTLEKITDAIDKAGLSALAAEDVMDYPPQTISQTVAHHFGMCGPNYLLSNACAAGSFAIGQALFSIRAGACSAMLVGGSDSFARYAFSGFCRLGAVAPDVPRPFSKTRKGMIPGEGAGALLLETYESAMARGASPYAEVAGYGESCDAHHITQPQEDGIAQAMNRALRSCGLSPGDIDYISVHGTGTPANDLAETRALNRVFGAGLARIPVSAVKSMLGHSMGAASALECVAVLLSLKHQYLVPTINFEERDPECDLDCIPNAGRPAKIKHILKTASAFGGNNACVILKHLAA